MRTGTVEEHVAEVFVYERRQWVSECTYLTISASRGTRRCQGRREGGSRNVPGAPVGELVSLVC
jgi:hypothetical protein